MDETVYLLLEGGIVQPISHVTANRTTSDVVVYDGETYRDDPYLLLADLSSRDLAGSPGSGAKVGSPLALYVGHGISLTGAGSESSTPATHASDLVSHTPPRHKAKQATLWSFTRTISAQAAFTHVVWAHQVIATGSHPPYRIGMTPTTVT